MIRINMFTYIQQAMRQQGISADTPEQVRQAIALLYRSHSANVIAARFGVTPTTIIRWLKDHGVPLRPRGGARMIGKPVTLNGETRYWKDWFPPDDWPTRERQMLYHRIVRSGWTLDRALTEPLLSRSVTTQCQRRDSRQRERWVDDENYDN